MKNKTYWAAESEENIGGKILQQFDAWKTYLIDAGTIKDLRKSYKAWYGSPEIKSVGDAIVGMHVNNYASLGRNLHVMVTSQRPAWQPRAINSDLESQAQAELGSGILDYYMREKDIETKINRTTELSLFLKEGWIVVDWDVNAGEPIAVDETTGETVFEGDISAQVYALPDVCRDIYRRDPINKWYIVREFKNKYDLAATYQDLSEKILGLNPDNRDDIDFELNPWFINRQVDMDSDLVPIYKLYHDKTPAMPEGRLTIIADKDIVLFDGPLPYKRLYLFPISTTHVHDMALGHSNLFDLLPLQDALNTTLSAILTNISANAVQNFQMPKGSGLKVTQVSDGMKVVEFDPKLGGLQPLDLLKTAPEVYNFQDLINNWMQRLVNISDISRGNAPASMSGTAMALLQQQSLQFNSGLQLAHSKLLENVGTAIIELLQEFAEEPRLAVIAGKNNQSLMKQFSGKDLQAINRVIVDSANPLMKTAAGRVEIANQLLQTQGMIKTPEQYLGVLTTGNLEPLYEYDRSRQHLVKAENEKLLAGEQIEALLTDDHANHALEHSCVANNIEARKDPTIMQNLLAHIQQHIDMASQMSPQMAAMLKQTSFAPPPPQAGPIPDGGGVNPQAVESPQGPGVPLPEPAESPLQPMQ